MVILLFLTGTLMGAFNFGFFLLGYYVRGKRSDDGVVATKENKDFLEELIKWQRYGGEK